MEGLKMLSKEAKQQDKNVPTENCKNVDKVKPDISPRPKVEPKPEVKDEVQLTRSRSSSAASEFKVDVDLCISTSESETEEEKVNRGEQIKEDPVCKSSEPSTSSKSKLNVSYV
ncbi:hypothetical protein V9T40_002359 [Parthenolecanium corni]|uniref:Uncharacterized protein n=1 Tax=Parthenolecanium corni TaxID=536013 RepID=A0AAN9Y3R0_9HEMI